MNLWAIFHQFLHVHVCTFIFDQNSPIDIILKLSYSDLKSGQFDIKGGQMAPDEDCLYNLIKTRTLLK